MPPKINDIGFGSHGHVRKSPNHENEGIPVSPIMKSKSYYSKMKHNNSREFSVYCFNIVYAQNNSKRKNTLLFSYRFPMIPYGEKWTPDPLRPHTRSFPGLLTSVSKIASRPAVFNDLRHGRCNGGTSRCIWNRCRTPRKRFCWHRLTLFGMFWNLLICWIRLINRLNELIHIIFRWFILVSAN